jgi:hypothetical protein
MKVLKTLKGFVGRRTLSGFNPKFSTLYPGLSLRSNPGLELANAFGVLSQRFGALRATPSAYLKAHVA